MGFKVNDSTELNLDEIIDALALYHGNKFIVGYDKSFVDTPHYHINWFAVKPVSESARKTFRNSMNKKFPYLTKADKLYTGEVLPSADNNRWIAYAMKETLIRISNIELTDDIKILAKSCFENKRQNKVYSEKKVNEEKEKKNFKQKLIAFVKDDYQNVLIPDGYGINNTEEEKIRISVIRFLMQEEREGSLNNSLINRYCMACNIKILGWDEFRVYTSLMSR